MGGHKMKKVILLSTLLLSFLLCACSSNDKASAADPLFSNDGDSFDCTAEELVSFLNEGAEQNNIPTIDYDGSYGDITIFGSGLTIDFLSSEETLDSVTLYWYQGAGDETSTYAGYYIGALIEAFDPNSSDALAESLSEKLPNLSGYSNTTLTGEQIEILLTSFGNGGTNICFKPHGE